jgi:hypothetical protein
MVWPAFTIEFCGVIKCTYSQYEKIDAYPNFQCVIPAQKLSVTTQNIDNDDEYVIDGLNLK